MNNSPETVELSLLPPVCPELSAEDPPEVSSEPEKYPNRFKPGQSGNPAGRPKRTEEEKEAMEKIRSLAPRAAEEMENILHSKTASLYAKIQVIDIILSRTYGKPETALKLETVQQSVEASQDRINSLVEKIRAGKGIYNWLTLHGVPGLLAAFAGFVRLQVKQNRAIKAGLQAMLRDRLLQAYHHCKNMGRADPDDRTNFENLYTQYHSLGGNGVMDDIRQKFFNLPM